MNIKYHKFTKGEVPLYQPMFKQKVVGILAIGFCSYIVVKGRYTPSLCSRDCGDYFIVARYDRYDRVDKETFKITKDVEDK